MATVTLPTTTKPSIAGIPPKFIQAGMAITQGRSLYKGSDGLAYHASNSHANKAQVIGIAVSSCSVAGSWVQYIEPNNKLDCSGLTKGTAYFLDHGTDEVQTVTITGTPTGGTFRLSFKGVETGNLAYNIANAAFLAALEGLSTIGAGNVTVTGASSPFTVTFRLLLGAEDVAMLVLSNNSLTGGSTPSVTIVETTPGVQSGNLCLYADVSAGWQIIPMGVALSTTQLMFDTNYPNVVV